MTYFNMIPLNFLRRLFIAFLMLGIASMTTGCFDIDEVLKLNKDGSGSYSMKMDMSELGEMISSMGAGEGPDAWGQMDSSIRATADKLRESDGISNVTTKSEGYVITVSYDFKSLAALNEANNSLGSDNPMMGSSEGASYDFNRKKRVFKRLSPDMSELLQGMDEDEQSMEMAKMVLGSANYKMTYIMPGKVKTMTNKDAVIGEDGKTVTLNTSFLDILEQKADMANEIKFKKR